jgi:hypothetical protein
MQDRDQAYPAAMNLTPNLPIETDLRKRASPLASAAHWRNVSPQMAMPVTPSLT